MITLESPMIKTLILTIIFGLIVGLGLGGTVFYLRQTQKSNQSPSTIIPTLAPENNSENDLKPSPSPANTDTKITITSHQNYDIVTTSKITLKGSTTLADSVIIISTPVNVYQGTTDKDGNFSQSIDLESGYNRLTISVINSNNQENHINYYLTYSTAKIE